MFSVMSLIYEVRWMKSWNIIFCPLTALDHSSKWVKNELFWTLVLSVVCFVWCPHFTPTVCIDEHYISSTNNDIWGEEYKRLHL